VGHAKRVAMGDLRALLEELGFRDVRTLLNSGNVVFAAPGGTPAASARRIEAAVAARLGVESRVLVLGGDELARTVAENPLAEEGRDPSRLLVSFLADATDRRKLAPLVGRAWGAEALAVGARVAYLWCPAGVLASAAAAAAQRALGDAITTRNWATVRKLHALAAGSSR
jgi:uncharacterized protein (DUF1697 family)